MVITSLAVGSREGPALEDLSSTVLALASYSYCSSSSELAGWRFQRSLASLSGEASLIVPRTKIAGSWRGMTVVLWWFLESD
jgi:hypothetical protein